MITEEYFLKKVSELAHMRCITITKQAAKEVFARFPSFEPEDLDAAIDQLLFNTDERFDFTKLLQSMTHRRADRLEAEARSNRISEGEAAKDFFNESRYTGKCERTECLGCPHLQACQVRGREWIKGINSIIRASLGKKGATELIRYMKNDFMGGVYPSTPGTSFTREELQEEIPF